MSILTLYADNPEQSGSSAGLLTPTQPGASTSTTGWIVGNAKSGARYSRTSFRVEKPDTSFGAVAEPSGAPTGETGGAQDSWRLSAATTGDFSAGTWYSSLSVIAVSSGGTIPTARVLTSGQSTTNAAAYLTPPVTPTANSLVLLAAACSGTGLRSVTTVVGGGVSNWVSVISAAYDTVAAPTNRISVWRAMTATPGAASAISIRWSGTASNTQWSVVEFSGVTTGGTDGSAAIVSSASTRLDTASGLTVILGSFASVNNFVYAAFSYGTQLSNAVTPGTGFTELSDVGSGEPVISGCQTMWSASSLSRAGAFCGSAANVGAVAIELAYAPPAGRARFRLWRSANADGTGATEITAGAMSGTTIEGLLTTVAQSSSASTAVGAFSLANEYLFLQTAWEIMSPGVAASDDRLVRFGSMGATDGSGLVTANFTATGGAAAVFGAYYLDYYRRLVLEEDS